jgi:hypothetical protein
MKVFCGGDAQLAATSSLVDGVVRGQGESLYLPKSQDLGCLLQHDTLRHSKLKAARFLINRRQPSPD